MLTPSAVIITLRQRGMVTTDAQKQQLLDEIKTTSPTETNTPKRAANIDNAVKKWCGVATTTDIVKAIETKSLGSIQAQYLIFGRVDKLRFAKFKTTVGL
jgi:hypothetical protein